MRFNLGVSWLDLIGGDAALDGWDPMLHFLGAV